MKKLFIILLILFPLLLSGCNKAEEPEKLEAGGVDFTDMTEEERIDAMIKLIEAEEAKMGVAEGAEAVEEEATE